MRITLICVLDHPCVGAARSPARQQVEQLGGFPVAAGVDVGDHPVEAAHTAHADLMRMADAIDRARELWARDVGVALGLSIGFNRLDGD